MQLLKTIIFIFILLLIYYLINIEENKEEKYIIKDKKGKDKNIIYELEEDCDYLPLKTHNNYIKIQEEFKEYNHNYFDINEMADYISKNFKDRYIKLFILLKDRRDKIKFFNLCFIYREGGIAFNDIIKDKKYTEKGDKNIKEELKNVFLNPKINKINEKWLNYTISTNNKEYNNINKKNSPRITLLMRSYKRPDYLKRCIESLKQINLDIFYEKIILDDFSQDLKLIEIYEELKNLGFKIKINNVNIKQKSFIKCLDLVNKDSDYIFYLDNDMIVKKDIVEKNLFIYNDIKKQCNLDESKILLSSFDCNNTSRGTHKIIKRYDNFNEKNTIGAANLFFSTCLIEKFKRWWAYDEDFGICEKLKEENGKIFTTNKSYSQHIGENGYNSYKFYFINNYDVAKNF